MSISPINQQTPTLQPSPSTTPLNTHTSTRENRDVLIHAAPDTSDLGCIGNIVRFFVESFKSLKNWITDLFFPEAPSDPALLARWDAVVEKDYDPVGSVNPEYDEAYSASWRGRTAADALVKAASKTGVNPPFNQILVRRLSFNENGSLFVSDSHGDGGYNRLEQRARNGAFNNPETLILYATSDNFSEERKLELIRMWIRWGEEGGYPINNATFFILDESDTNQLLRDRMPASLLAFFQARQ